MSDEEGGGADWSNLPYDLLEETLNQLVKDTIDISDYARCAAVCVSWRQVYNTHKPLINPQLPLLMIPSNTPSSKDNDSDQFYSFYKITDGKVGKVYDQLRIRMPSYRQFRGSSYGWLVTVDDDVDKGFPVRLFHPFLSYEISLPSLKHLPVYEEDDGDPRNCAYLHKAILSADPLSISDKYIVMVIYGGERYKRLAYWRPGDQVWIPIGPKRIKFEGVMKVEDVIVSNEHEFVAVTSEGTTFSFKIADILHENVADLQYNVQMSFRKLPPVTNKKLYLVPTSKSFAYVLVLRFIDIGDEDETTKTRPYSTDEFIVFEPHAIKGREGGWSTFVWKKTNTLEGNTLFIGGNASMSICAANCPPIFKPDCIYYTDDCYLGYVKQPAGNEHGAHDMGLFNLKDNSFEKHYPTDENNPIWPISIWVVFWVDRIIRKEINVLRDSSM